MEVRGGRGGGSWVVRPCVKMDLPTAPANSALPEPELKKPPSPRCNHAEEAPPLHYLPRPAAWVSHSHQVLALGGLELEEKQRLFPAYAQGSPYPSNALVLATLHRRQ